MPEISATRFSIWAAISEAAVNSPGTPQHQTLRSTKGLTYLVAYTWSKAIDEGGGPRPSGGDPLHVRNEYDLHANRGLSAFDPGRRFVTSLVYELPFGSGKSFGSNRGLLSHLIGGWQVGSIVTFADGLPTDVGTIGESLNLGSSSGNYA